MKQIERYLCALCWQDIAAAGLKHEEINGAEKERRPCDWCGRNCYSAHYRIYYSGRDKN